MPIHRYAKAILLSPSIGSSIIGILGVMVGVFLIVSRGRLEVRKLADAGRPVSSTASASMELPVAPGVFDPLRSVTRLNKAIQMHAKEGSRAHEVTFKRPIASDRLEFLSDYAGRSANEVVHEPQLHSLVNSAVPYAPFHMGLDVPLPHAIEGMLSLSSMPVTVRDDRYVMLTGTRGSNGRGRAFLWVDTHEGLVLGGIFFYPSNGEPTPTLTIFSRQVTQQSLRMRQLPVAFVQDLSAWAAAVGVPPITTRYFINASSEKTVLAHDEDFCKSVELRGDPRDASCRQMNAQAAQIDLQASHFLDQTNYASNATMRMMNVKQASDGVLAR